MPRHLNAQAPGPQLQPGHQLHHHSMADKHSPYPALGVPARLHSGRASGASFVAETPQASPLESVAGERVPATPDEMYDVGQVDAALEAQPYTAEPSRPSEILHPQLESSRQQAVPSPGLPLHGVGAPALDPQQRLHALLPGLTEQPPQLALSSDMPPPRLQPQPPQPLQPPHQQQAEPPRWDISGGGSASVPSTLPPDHVAPNLVPSVGAPSPQARRAAAAVLAAISSETERGSPTGRSRKLSKDVAPLPLSRAHDLPSPVRSLREDAGGQGRPETGRSPPEQHRRTSPGHDGQRYPALQLQGRASSGGAPAQDAAGPDARGGRRRSSDGGGSGPVGSGSESVPRARLNLASRLTAYAGLGGATPSPLSADPGRQVGAPRCSAVALPPSQAQPGKVVVVLPGGAGAPLSAARGPAGRPGLPLQQQPAGGLALTPAGAAAAAAFRHAQGHEDRTPAGQVAKGAPGGPPCSTCSTPFSDGMLAALDSLERRMGPPGGAAAAATVPSPVQGVTALELMRQQQEQQHIPGHAAQPPWASHGAYGYGQSGTAAEARCVGAGQGIGGGSGQVQAVLPALEPPVAATGTGLQGLGGREVSAAGVQHTPDVVARNPFSPARESQQLGNEAPGGIPTPELESGSMLAALDAFEQRHLQQEAAAAAQGAGQGAGAGAGAALPVSLGMPQLGPWEAREQPFHLAAIANFGQGQGQPGPPPAVTEACAGGPERPNGATNSMIPSVDAAQVQALHQQAAPALRDSPAPVKQLFSTPLHGGPPHGRSGYAAEHAYAGHLPAHVPAACGQNSTAAGAAGGPPASRQAVVWAQGQGPAPGLPPRPGQGRAPYVPHGQQQPQQQQQQQPDGQAPGPKLPTADKDSQLMPPPGVTQPHPPGARSGPVALATPTATATLPGANSTSAAAAADSAPAMQPPAAAADATIGTTGQQALNQAGLSAVDHDDTDSDEEGRVQPMSASLLQRALATEEKRRRRASQGISSSQCQYPHPGAGSQRPSGNLAASLDAAATLVAGAGADGALAAVEGPGEEGGGVGGEEAMGVEEEDLKPPVELEKYLPGVVCSAYREGRSPSFNLYEWQVGDDGVGSCTVPM